MREDGDVGPGGIGEGDVLEVHLKGEGGREGEREGGREGGRRDVSDCCSSL